MLGSSRHQPRVHGCGHPASGREWQPYRSSTTSRGAVHHARAVCEWSLSRFKVLEQWDPPPGRFRPLEWPSATRVRCRTDSLVRLSTTPAPLQVRSISEFVMPVFAGGASRTDVPVADLASARHARWAPMVDRIFPVVVGRPRGLVDQYWADGRRAGCVLEDRLGECWLGLDRAAVLADHRWVVWMAAESGLVWELAVLRRPGRSWTVNV